MLALSLSLSLSLSPFAPPAPIFFVSASPFKRRAPLFESSRQNMSEVDALVAKIRVHGWMLPPEYLRLDVHAFLQARDQKSPQEVRNFYAAVSVVGALFSFQARHPDEPVDHLYLRLSAPSSHDESIAQLKARSKLSEHELDLRLRKFTAELPACMQFLRAAIQLRKDSATKRDLLVGSDEESDEE